MVERVHEPVLLAETIALMAPASGGIYVDATLGLGGHSRAILERSSPEGQVIGFEWDEAALALARDNLAEFGGRIRFVHRSYAELRQGLAELGVERVDGLLLDLGLSSLQLDAGGRGFSFRRDEPLDMRMDTRRELTAAELINTYGEDELADIFFQFGEERQSRRIAARIVAERGKARVETAERLADIVAEAFPKRFHPKKIHVATRVFQALRIAVNRELENLVETLTAALTVLKPGGRICVISFHSLEDRLVKWRFREETAFEVLTRKPIVPTPEECNRNPRARSAKLRAARLRGLPNMEAMQ
jgi:16S rRNA (cytosine1402-N4)-methyltransferase